MPLWHCISDFRVQMWFMESKYHCFSSFSGKQHCKWQELVSEHEVTNLLLNNCNVFFRVLYLHDNLHITVVPHKYIRLALTIFMKSQLKSEVRDPLPLQKGFILWFLLSRVITRKKLTPNSYIAWIKNSLWMMSKEETQPKRNIKY